MKPWEYREELHGKSHRVFAESLPNPVTPPGGLAEAVPDNSPYRSSVSPVKLQRVQFQRGRKLPPGTAYVGRARNGCGNWGNPYKAKDGHAAAEAVTLFEAYALERLQKEPEWLEPLRGKHLACWCAPGEPCHADVLLRLAILEVADMPLLSRFAHLPNRMTLPYVEQGSSSGIPVLLLHGFAGSWRSFSLLLPHLPESIHAFAISQRGHRNAGAPQSGYRLDDFARDVAAFMDELHLKAAVIVGHSMGSSIAQRFALEYPDKLLGLVLVGSSLASRGNPHLQAFWESRLAELTDPIDPAFIQEFLDTSLPQALPSAFIQAARRDAQSVPARVWKEAFRSRLEEDLSANLHTIETPTLLIWGDQDARSSQSDQEALIAMLPNSSLVVYLGAGHDPTIEEPARFAADLLSFINELGS